MSLIKNLLIGYALMTVVIYAFTYYLADVTLQGGTGVTTTELSSLNYITTVNGWVSDFQTNMGTNINFYGFGAFFAGLISVFLSFVSTIPVTVLLINDLFTLLKVPTIYSAGIITAVSIAILFSIKNLLNNQE